MDLPFGPHLRDEEGRFLRVVEDRDCTQEQRSIRELNAGVYAFECRELLRCLELLRNDNAQGEYYLTDVPELMRCRGGEIGVCCVELNEQIIGVNTVEAASAGRGIFTAETAWKWELICHILHTAPWQRPMTPSVLHIPMRCIEDILMAAAPEMERPILEIGAGTGKGTEQFLTRGYSVDAVELEPEMAALLAARMKTERLRLSVGSFENWEPPCRRYQLGVLRPGVSLDRPGGKIQKVL